MDEHSPVVETEKKKSNRVGVGPLVGRSVVLDVQNMRMVAVVRSQTLTTLSVTLTSLAPPVGCVVSMTPTRGASAVEGIHDHRWQVKAQSRVRVARRFQTQLDLVRVDDEDALDLDWD
jgi:hypothetical protein